MCSWTDTKARDILTPDILDLYDRAETIATGNPWQFRSDLVRYSVLHIMGGVWIDADLEPLRAIDPLRELNLFAAKEDEHYINIAFLGAREMHPVMRAALDGLPESAREHKSQRANRISGPHYFTPLAKDITLLPTADVYPYHWSDLDRQEEHHSDNGWTVHHWHNRRTKNGQA